jgi:hypothetical protein
MSLDVGPLTSPALLPSTDRCALQGTSRDGQRRAADIRLNDSGSTENCVGEPPTDARVHAGYLRLIYSNSYAEIGAFDCWYRSLRIRYRKA